MGSSTQVQVQIFRSEIEKLGSRVRLEGSGLESSRLKGSAIIILLRKSDYLLVNMYFICLILWRVWLSGKLGQMVILDFLA